MKVCLLFFFLLSWISGFSQDSLATSQSVDYDSDPTIVAGHFSEEKIEDYKNDPDFNYLENVENTSWWTRFKSWINSKIKQFFDWMFGDYQGGTFLTFLMTIIPYLFIGLILGFIVWLFIRLNPGNSLFGEPKRGNVFLNEEEELVYSEDLQQLIEKAIANGEYRLAVRYHYLLLLKLLNEREIITYAFQKTNSDYLTEISNEKIRHQVKKLMRIYDFIWYGDFKITASEFQRAGNQFANLQTSMNLKTNE